MKLDYDAIINICDKRIRYLEEPTLDEFYNSFGADTSGIRGELSQFFLQDLKLNLFKRLKTLPAFIFQRADYLPEKLEVPNNITDYYKAAFAEADGIKELKLSSTSATIIPKFFMQECQTIERVILPETVQVIDHSAFLNCSNLQNINMPSSLQEIKQDAFMGTKIKEVVLPKGFKRLESEAFGGAESLTSITLPESIEYIDPEALKWCASLEEIIVPASVLAKKFRSVFAGVVVTKNGILDTSDPLTAFYASRITSEYDDDEDEEEEEEENIPTSTTTSSAVPQEEEEEEI